MIVEAREVLKNLDKISKDFPKLGLRLKKEYGEAGVKHARVECPKVSDNLVSTIRLEVRGLDVFVLAGGIWGKYVRKGYPIRFVDYARFVHDGTYKMAANPFLVKGVNAALANKELMARKVVRNWLNRIL